MNTRKKKAPVKAEPKPRFVMDAEFRHNLTEDEVLAIQTGRRSLVLKLEIVTEKDPGNFLPKMNLLVL